MHIKNKQEKNYPMQAKGNGCWRMGGGIADQMVED